MLIKTIFIILVFFAFIYTVMTWARSPRKPANKKFKDHYIIANQALGIVFIGIWFLPVALNIKLMVTAWKLLLLSVSNYAFKKRTPRTPLYAVPVIFGLFTARKLYKAFFIFPNDIALACILILVLLISLVLYRWAESQKKLFTR